jgi:putative membrane protein
VSDVSILQDYSFWILWNPGMIVITVILAAIYLTVVGPLRHLFPDAAPISLGRKASFLVGIMIFYFTLGSPLHLIGHEFLFSAHMLEQALVYMVMPPLLLIGTPAWLLRLLLNKRFPKKLMPLLTHPMLTMVFFSILFSFYHFPLIFDQINTNDTLHNMFHTVLTVGAFLMWWPIISPIPEWDSLSGLRKIGCLFISTLLLTPVCVLIVFANTPMYDTYSHVPQLFSILTPLRDQQLGGIIMKVVQELTYITAMAILFFKWARKERSKDSMVIN